MTATGCDRRPKTLLGAVLAILLIHGCGEMRTEWAVTPDFLGPGEYRIEGLCSIQEDIYLTGTFHAPGGRATCFTARYGGDGALDWHQTIEAAETGTTRGRAIIAVPTRDETLKQRVEIYVLIQAYREDGGPREEVLLTRYDGDGEVQWQQVVLGHDGPLTANLMSDAEGGIYVAGCSRDGVGRPTLYVGKYDDTGEPSWFTQYYNELVAYDELRFDVQSGPPAGIAAAGVLNGTADIFFARCDEHGMIQPIVRHATGASATEIVGVAAGPDRGIHVAATVFDAAGQSDLLTLTYDRTDGLLWAERYDGAARRDEYGRAIAVDDSSNVYVTGSSENTGGIAQIVTVKYDRAGNVAWSAVLQDDDPVEMSLMEPARLHVGKDLGEYLYITAARGNRASLIKCTANGRYAARVDYGRPGKACRPTALSGGCVAVECVSDNAVETRLVKFGPSKMLGIARWD